MNPLPIDPSLPEIVAALRVSPAVVVEAPPGAGKTTRVPRALLDAGLAAAGEILVVQPRRLPARLAAERVAAELGEPTGQTVGYTVRFEDLSGPRTRVRYVTEGILSRRLLGDPELRGVGTVVLDEFHERHVATDLALALLRSLQEGSRPDLKLCVMSATLDADPVRAYLRDCPRVRSEGRSFDVAVEYLAEPDQRALAEQVAAGVRRAVREGPPGDLLVFLPGAGEIRRAQESLATAAQTFDLEVVPLHGEMSLGDQNRAVRPAARRKVILSTNVAETSVTIDGVVAVIDCGLARIATTSPWSGLPAVALSKISQASATQRAGRAGRTRPGRAYRLYTRHDHDLRRRFDLPEIARTDLCETVLALHAVGVRDPAAFPWFEAPPAAALAAAEELLAQLGALEVGAGGRGGALGELGRRMLRFPVHPRLARLICEGERRGAAEGACLAAALIGERDVRERARPSFAGGERGRASGPGGGGRGADLLELIDLFRQAAAARFSRERIRSLGLDGRALETVDRARRQLVSLCGKAAPRPSSVEEEEKILQLATLTGFPDRVGRRRDKGRGVVLSGGGAAELGLELSAPGLDLLVAIDVEERAPPGAGPGRPGGATTIRLSVAIEPEWLLDLYADRMRESDELTFNPTTERVERICRLGYGAIALEESVVPAPLSPETSRRLADAALAHGLERFDQPGVLAALTARITFAREIAPDAPLPATDDAALREAVATACEGLRSFAELWSSGIAARLLQALPPDAQRLLRSIAPESLLLPGGRSIAIHYQAGQPPWIESRLQDFFGMTRGPTIGGDRAVPLTIHLLAPNGRAVQVTRDLESFWQQHYPPLRRELGRRYPKHAWPEDGRTARPPPPRPPRK